GSRNAGSLSEARSPTPDENSRRPSPRGAAPPNRPRPSGADRTGPRPDRSGENQVVQGPRSRQIPFPPAVADFRAIAVKVGFVQEEVTQATGFHQTADGEKITVPPPVVIHAEQNPLFSGQIDQFLRLFGGDGEGFLDDHMLAGGDRRLG